MKKCENCGGLLGKDHPFAVCPRCLLGDALNRPAPLEPAAGSAAHHRQDVPQIPIRTDFFQKYEVLEKIGGGGQGEIWKVWDFEFRRVVAMKRMAGDSSHPDQAAYRFLAEAQITSQLDHPGILPVFDVGRDLAGRLFYTTQLLPGTTFRDVWREVQGARDSEKSLNRALELLLRVCEILAHAHNRGVIHRDLKPANILVGAFGDVRVIDWGSARILEHSRAEFEEPFVRLDEALVQTDRSETLKTEPGSPHATVNSGMPLTTAFAAPELMRGQLELLGAKTDIYSLGVMLYELLAGRMPYTDSSGKLPDPLRLKALILAGPPPRLRSFKPAISRDLAAICEQAMAHDWRDRTPSAVELAEDIRAVLEIRPVRARHPGPWLVLQKWVVRNAAYVVTGCLCLVFLSVVASVAHGFKAQRDSARQIQDLREAELAARNGHWREAIRGWDAAAAHGYADSVYLGLKKAEALTVLNLPDQAEALLNWLAARTDLGSQRADVMLRLGELEVTRRRTSAHGLQLIRDAMTAGLTNADLYIAQGLLADSTPAALDLFHQALRFDPYNYEAHSDSLGLEFILGRHQELSNDVAVFKILYPDDSAPNFISAIEAAMRGDLPAAHAALALMRNQVTSTSWKETDQLCHTFARAEMAYDVDTLLRRQPPGRTLLDYARTNPFAAGMLLMSGDFTGVTNWTGDLRTPQSPYIKQGEFAGQDGLRRLMQPYIGNPLIAVQEIELSWRHHPEAMVPVIAGMLLENQQPRSGPRSLGIGQIQARLYQMAADSPAMVPNASRLARYLAARTEFELATSQETNAASAASNCVANIRLAAASPETSADECHAYIQFALGLGKTDLALQMVDRLENQPPPDLATRRDRIQVDLAVGAFGPALDKINQLLVDHPNDPWALTQLQTARSGLRALIDANTHFLNQKP